MAFSKDKRPYQILAVDDIPDNLALIEAILADEGYIVRSVTAGAAALDIIYADPPDLVLLDVMMPDMDGYEVTRRIRQAEGLPYIPVLLITADHRSNVVKGLDTGADDFIRKPVDIDELVARVRSLLRLKQSIDDQREILQQREDFVTRLTHDLRTPLVAANRMLQFCIDNAFGNPGEELSAVLSNLRQNNDNLLQMTNNLLEVYRHESGHKNLTLTTFDLWGLTQKVVAELEPLCRDRDLALTLENLDRPGQTKANGDFYVHGDQLELRRVLTNLIGNAIKFTEQGSVKVALQHLSQPSGDQGRLRSQVKLTVTDTGPGIPSADLPHIFEWFRAGSHRRSNSGLGLHLSRRIVDMHGGSISVSSQVREGSVFTLLLPGTERSPLSSPQDQDEESERALFSECKS